MMIKSLTTGIYLLVLTARASRVDIWAFDIDNGPAPSPENGPPFARNAVRNAAYLKYQIAGIVAGYFAFILIFGLFLLLIGRPMRQKALSSHDSVATELVKRSKHMLDPSPISPSSTTRSWRKWTKTRQGVVTSPQAGSASMTMSPKEAIIQTTEMSTTAHDRGLTATGNTTQRMPLRLDTSGVQLSYTLETTTASPRSPMRAIYPPYNAHGTGTGAPDTVGFTDMAPVVERARYKSRISPIQSQRSQARYMHRGSRSSLLGRSASIRSLDISAPMLLPASAVSIDYPMTPRFYPDPGPAPMPPSVLEEEVEDRHTSSVYTAPPEIQFIYDDTLNQPSHPYHSSSVYDELEAFDSPRPAPHPAPQRQPAQRFAPSPPPESFTRSSPSPKPLPLRVFANSPSHSPTTIARNKTLAAFTATPMRVTLLSPRRDMFNTYGSPRSAGFVPYSPYMPFMPVTPVTARLPTRAEKMQRKQVEEGLVRRGEEVRSEADLWGDAYRDGTS